MSRVQSFEIGGAHPRGLPERVWNAPPAKWEHNLWMAWRLEAAMEPPFGGCQPHAGQRGANSGVEARFFSARTTFVSLVNQFQIACRIKIEEVATGLHRMVFIEDLALSGYYCRRVIHIYIFISYHESLMLLIVLSSCPGGGAQRAEACTIGHMVAAVTRRCNAPPSKCQK